MWPFNSKLDRMIEDTTTLISKTNDLLDGRYVERSEHERRVKELLSNNTREMERRRDAEKDAAEAEKETLKILNTMRDNKALVKAVDWASTELKTSSCTAGHVFDCIKVFVMGYNHKTIVHDAKGGQLMDAYKAGADAAAKDRALFSSAEATGLMTRSKDKTT
jgi:hypothetical protein